VKTGINQTAEQIKLYLFVVSLVGLLMLSLSLVGGRFLGYKTALLVGMGIGIVVVVCFFVILIANVTAIGIQKVVERLGRKLLK
jgi:ABC-type transport system involved in multi-copper enzyme maturation permease subunit